MGMRTVRLATLTILLATAGLVGGCNLLAWPLHAIAYQAPKVKKAEFDGLAGKTVAVVPYAGLDVLYEHPQVREELIAAVNSQLRQHVEDVRTVAAGRIVRYQDGNTRWDSMPLSEVGRKLAVDCVLYISVSEFSVHERGSINLGKGRISAAISVWDTQPVEPGTSQCLWENNNITVVEDVPGGDRRAFRLKTEQSFADVAVKNFYDHKVSTDP